MTRMSQIAFYEAFAFNHSTCEYDLWMGTAPLETIKRLGLAADLGYVLYGDASMCVDGWACKARRDA